MVLRVRNAGRLLLLVGLVAALPYLATPQPPYAEEQTWLLRFSVEVEAAKIVIAPLLGYCLLWLLVSKVRSFGRNGN